jgi:hypothetical protein
MNAAKQEMFESIRSVIAGRLRDEMQVRELAHRVSDESTSLRRRVERAVGYARAGLRLEACAVAEADPSVFDLSAAFDPLSPVTFRFDRLETNPRFATISQPSNAAIVARLRIDMEDRGGRLELLLPYATLEPVREMLLQQFMGEKFGRDSIWEGHLATELWATDVDIHAVVDEQVMTLQDVLDFKVGTRLMLNATPESEIKMLCGPESLFKGSFYFRFN